jgi:ubiquinone/menaquinone biosynthesis C-methylase UbiE
MNTEHQRLCSSREWEQHLHATVLPAVTGGLALGEQMLELGAGPGAATDWLRRRVGRLVVIEREQQSVDALKTRFDPDSVEVVHGDATALAFAADSFDSVAAFTMLHHVPTRALQARLLSEAFRVLRPGGVLVGSDSVHSDELHRFHHEDTYNPIEPATLLALLGALGYVRIKIEVDDMLTFVAHKPEVDPDHPRIERVGAVLRPRSL